MRRSKEQQNATGLLSTASKPLEIIATDILHLLLKASTANRWVEIMTDQYYERTSAETILKKNSPTFLAQFRITSALHVRWSLACRQKIAQTSWANSSKPFTIFLGLNTLLSGQITPGRVGKQKDIIKYPQHGHAILLLRTRTDRIFLCSCSNLHKIVRSTGQLEWHHSAWYGQGIAWLNALSSSISSTARPWTPDCPFCSQSETSSSHWQAGEESKWKSNHFAMNIQVIMTVALAQLASSRGTSGSIKTAHGNLYQPSTRWRLTGLWNNYHRHWFRSL